MRSNTLDAARRAYLGLVRGTVHQTDDSHLWQTIDARLLHGELLTGIEHVQHYGYSYVPLPPDPDGKKAAELVVGFLNGNRSHPIVLGVNDRRYRPKNWKPGEAGLWHYKGATAKHTDTGWVYDAGSGKQPHTTTVGNATVTVADGKITLQVNNTKVIVKDGKILLGGDDASIPVMLQSGPSNLIFATS